MLFFHVSADIQKTHYWLLAAAHRCCWGYHSLLPFQGALFRLLNRCAHTLSHSQLSMHTCSFHSAEPDRGVLQVNRCMLLTCISACCAFLFPADCVFMNLFCSARNFFVWHVGISLFSRKERVALVCVSLFIRLATGDLSLRGCC